jgi:hypothetical protein
MRPQIISLERISNNGLEIVFPEKIDLLKLFEVSDLENAYETYSHDCVCDEYEEMQRQRDEDYYERRGF